MLSFLMLIKKLIKFLNSNETVENIAFSLTIALMMSLIPYNWVFHPIAFLILIAFNGNLFIFLFMTPILNWITPIIYTELHRLGTFILTNQSMTSTFESISNIPILIYTNWNNTVSMGGYVSVLIGSYPIYIFYKVAIKKYREILLPKIKKSKLIHLLKIPSLISIFKR